MSIERGRGEWREREKGVGTSGYVEEEGGAERDKWEYGRKRGERS